MAEFKLGRIRFVWKGTWTTGTQYLVDDVISNGGKSYICVVNHTASGLFATDLQAIPTKWNVVSDGSRWVGNWTPTTYYSIGDQVKYGGLVYICKTPHTSATNVSPTYLGLEADLAKWDLFATSFNWRNTWAGNTKYLVNDFVVYGGTTYVCKTSHISTNSATLTVTGASGNGTTVTLTFASQVIQPYSVGASITVAGMDPAGYDGTFTVTACTANSVSFASTEVGAFVTGGTISGPSNLGLEVDSANWDVFNQGIVYLGTWTNAGGVRYKLNDIVKYGADLWICTTAHSSTTNFISDQGNWGVFLKGFEFESTWNVLTQYQIGDTVTYGGYSYIAKTNHVGSVPTSSPSDWDVFTTGFNFRSDYLAGTNYLVGDVVRYGGITYLAIADNTNEPPSNGTFWSRLSNGLKWTNNATTYTGVSGTNVTGTGTSATFDIVRNNTVYAVTLNAAGTGYAVGNKIKILGTAIGGLSPVNDLEITVATITGGGGTGPIDTVTSVGVAVSWKTGITYVLGDVALYGANSYICVQEHVASSGNRPDADLTGVYWNMLAAGAESASLTTTGDMFYYGPNGPTRLPIGTDGQVLRVNSGLPSWAYWGVVNNVVYVSNETGTDSLDAGWGLTIDKPWKTVRYACEQLEKGYLSRNACDLLEKNKQFIMKEVTNWITYNYTVAITASSAADNSFTVADTTTLSANMPIVFTGTVGGVTAGTTYYVKQVLSSTKFSISDTLGGNARVLTTQTASMSGTLSYNSTKCERDVGLLVDAVCYDIGHGGNEEITKAAKSYYTTAGNAYITSNFGTQLTQTIAAYNYLKTIIGNVLANTAPAQNYQTLNGVAVGSRAIQNIDLTLTAEAGSAASATALLTIVTDGLTAGSSISIPAAVNAQATVSIKTGTYNEILPIIVPKNTALVGDELRSTVISPAKGIALLANDKAKTISALNRIKSVSSNLIQNLAVTATSGNTQTQVTTLPAGNVGSTLAMSRVVANVTAIYDIINNGLTGVPNTVMPDPTGYDVNLSNARQQIFQNYAFIKADVSAYINNNYSAVWAALGATGQAKCQRDIGYILDAIRYDLTYGGNLQSLIAGSSYYSYLQLTIAASEKAATVAAYGHLRTIILNIAQKLAVTPQAGNATPQVTSGTGGNLASAQFAQARMQDVIDWVSNGTAPSTITPGTAWVDASLVAANAALQAAKAEIQTDGVGYVQKHHQYLAYDRDVCRRDIGYIVDALGYDLMFGSNFASIKCGMAYHRLTTSALKVVTSQKDAELGLVRFLQYKTKSVVATGAVAQVSGIIDDITAYITSGITPRNVWPDPSTIDSGFAAAKNLIWDNTAFIKADIIAWITANYPAITYSQDKCARDVGYLIDALRYDLTYGGSSASKEAGTAYYSGATLQIDAADKAATLAAYGRLKTIVQALAVDSVVTPTAGNTVAQVRGTAGSVAAQTAVGLLVDVITNIINNGLTTGVPRVTITTIATNNTFTTSAAHGLNVGDEIIPQSTANGLTAGTTYYVKSIPLTTTFTLAATWDGATLASFTNGTGLSILAETTDNPQYAWVDSGLVAQQTALSSAKSATQTSVINYINTNYPTLNYNSATCSRDIGLVIDALGYDLMFGSNYRSVIAGQSYYRAAASKAVGAQKTATLAAFRYLKTLVKATVSTNATALERVIDNMDFIINIIEKGVGNTPDTVGTTTYNNTLATIKGAEVLRANKTFLSYEATAWITQSFGGTVTNTTTSTNIITTSAAHNLTVGDPVVFSGTTFGGIVAGTRYFVLTVDSTTTFTIAETQTSTTAFALATASGTATVRYSFDATACRRDMAAYIDAIVYDLQWTGNYKSLFAANLYNNAVSGSLKSDMFYVRNATGVRNMTLTGLTGELSEANSYGTKRPTAGAYVSLDHGFGPADSKSWITSKSCYVQNVTTFGTGCTGGKIDGSLHLGGNRSMVANDFTQVLSDGIGIWCTGTESVTELVSVFSYYGYSGYLAELGGKIRATNGNSSYGTYGVVAEGVDSYETPITATVNNRAFQAQITNTITDGTNKILRFEYGNAGSNYTNTVHTINGSGFNATAVADEFRDGAVYETRIIDTNNGDGAGGTSYVSVANAAQGGTRTMITIAATDTALSAAYVGMRIQLTAGTGVGQYANILTYNNGNKEAMVYRANFAPLTITNTTVTSNLITVASTATLYDNMPFYVTTAIGGLSANTLYYVRTGFTATQFTASTTSGGVAVTLSTASGTVTMLQAGWDHIVPGTTIANALDLTTTYIIEPRITYSDPGYTSTAKTVTNALWSDSVYAAGRFVAIANGSTTTNYSSDGSGWASAGALTDSTMKSVTFGGGQGATATALIGGLGGQGAVLTAVLGVANTTGAATADQVASVTIVNGGAGYTTPPVIVFTPVSGGSGAVATCTVRDGVIKTVTVTIPGSGYTVAPTVTADNTRLTGITVGTWGKDYASVPTVTIDKPFAGTAWSSGGAGTSGTRYYYLNGSTENWYIATSTGTFTTSGPTHQSGTVANGTVSLQYIGTSATATAVLTNQGVSSYTITEQGAGYTSTPSIVVNDATAKYVALSGSSTTTCYQTPTGLGTAWTAGGALPASNFNSVTYGNGVFVAVGGASSATSSTNGTVWIGRTIPTLGAGTYVDVKYGAGYFVAISTGTNATAISTNGTTWTAGGNLPSSTSWQSLAYGNGRFVAIANGPSRTVAYSIDNGTTWTAVTPGLPSSQAWTKIEYGQGLFFAVATGTNIAATSPDGVTWTSRTLSANTTWNSVCFGNPLNNPTWVAISQNTAATQVKTGVVAQGRMRAVSGVITEVRMIEPGSGYTKGSVTATTTSTNLITVDNTTNLVANQPVEFFGTSAGGLTVGVTYYVISGTITSTQFKVSATSGSATPVSLSTVTGITGMTYRSGPIVTVTDPNNVKDVSLRVRLGDGALGNPSFNNRGTNNATASSSTQGDGYSDLYQPSTYINVAGLYTIPTAGANVEFASIPGTYFKLVAVTNVLGSAGNYTAQFQINPAITTYQAPDHGNAVTTRLKYSQVRLTGHDFLYIGTGNFSQTNYPNVDITTAKQNQQELFTAGGRVFFTSTDQDGNFNVGNLFGVQQATGTATLNASAFNLSGLQSLQLGSVTLGIGSAIITQFSTDPYFTANSDNIVPTQRAIRAYITSQIGGGSSALNVNTLTSGVVYIAGNSITTTTGVQINVNAKMNFTGGIDGAPVALGFFLQR